MWLVPSRGRPHLAQRLLDCRFREPGILILDRDNAERYGAVRLPHGWRKVVFERMWLSQKLNAAFETFPEEPWYGILNDDHLPVTPGWEKTMISCAGSWGISWPDDNYGKRISSHVKGGDLCRALGWFVCPDLKHYYLDDVDELIAKEVGGVYLDKIMVSHEHANAGRAPMDQTYRERPPPIEDKKAFEEWRKTKWPSLLENLKGYTKLWQSPPAQS